MPAGGAQRLFDQDIDHRLLKGGADLTDGHLRPRLTLLAAVVEHRRLEAAETEVEGLLIEPGPGEPDEIAIPPGGPAGNLRPSRVRQVEEFGDLVEGLSGRVVPGPAERGNVVWPSARYNEVVPPEAIRAI